MSRFRYGCVALLLVALCATGVSAQSTASISGQVKDASGGVMPGVAVVVKDDATGATQEAITDADGRYQATALGAGSYTVSASLSQRFSLVQESSQSSTSTCNRRSR